MAKNLHKLSIYIWILRIILYFRSSIAGWLMQAKYFLNVPQCGKHINKHKKDKTTKVGLNQGSQTQNYTPAALRRNMSLRAAD